MLKLAPGEPTFQNGDWEQVNYPVCHLNTTYSDSWIETGGS